jgi:hypothetical protein
MKFIRVRRDKGLIRLDKGKNLDSQWHFRCPCGLSMGLGGLWIASSSLGSQTLSSQDRQSLEANFFIVYFTCGSEILVQNSSCC